MLPFDSALNCNEAFDYEIKNALQSVWAHEY